VCVITPDVIFLATPDGGEVGSRNHPLRHPPGGRCRIPPSPFGVAKKDHIGVRTPGTPKLPCGWLVMMGKRARLQLTSVRGKVARVAACGVRKACAVVGALP